MSVINKIGCTLEVQLNAIKADYELDQNIFGTEVMLVFYNILDGVNAHLKGKKIEEFSFRKKIEHKLKKIKHVYNRLLGHAQRIILVKKLPEPKIGCSAASWEYNKKICIDKANSAKSRIIDLIKEITDLYLEGVENISKEYNEIETIKNKLEAYISRLVPQTKIFIKNTIPRIVNLLKIKQNNFVNTIKSKRVDFSSPLHSNRSAKETEGAGAAGGGGGGARKRVNFNEETRSVAFDWGKSSFEIEDLRRNENRERLIDGKNARSIAPLKSQEESQAYKEFLVRNGEI